MEGFLNITSKLQDRELCKIKILNQIFNVHVLKKKHCNFTFRDRDGPVVSLNSYKMDTQ